MPITPASRPFRTSVLVLMLVLGNSLIARADAAPGTLVPISEPQTTVVLLIGLGSLLMMGRPGRSR
ncbi:MAG: hypothetical protein JO317_06340 [Verrucomicrobiae bacterium]|nr:hypothetical protein [Verrucomicrobiae bacterium]